MWNGHRPCLFSFLIVVEFDYDSVQSPLKDLTNLQLVGSLLKSLAKLNERADRIKENELK